MGYKAEIISKECFGAGHYPWTSTSSRDGRIIVPVYYWDGKYMLESDDFGASFRKTEVPEKLRGMTFRELSDGTFMAIGEENAFFHSRRSSTC